MSPDTLYPLSPGNAWSYDVDTGEPETVLAISRVVEVDDAGRVSVQSGEQLVRYERRADGIYRVARDGYLLRSPIQAGASWDAGSGTRAEVSKLGVSMQTPAGRFGDCVEIAEQVPSGTRVRTTYCPGVGPVEVVSELALSKTTARVVARLRGYTVK